MRPSAWGRQLKGYALAVKSVRTIRGKPVLTRFWFEFEWQEGSSVLTGAPWGVGVTAFDRDDALRLLSVTVSADQDVPPVNGVVEDVDVESLDAGAIRVREDLVGKGGAPRVVDVLDAELA